MEMSRREFVAGLSASCFLCGCAGPAKEKEPEKKAPVAEPAGELVDLPSAIRAPGDQAKVTLADGTLVLVWKDEIGFHATEARCTHRRGELFYDRERNDIWCNEHGSRFYVDGAVEKPPAKVALRTFGVATEGERLRITLKS